MTLLARFASPETKAKIYKRAQGRAYSFSAIAELAAHTKFFFDFTIKHAIMETGLNKTPPPSAGRPSFGAVPFFSPKGGPEQHPSRALKRPKSRRRLWKLKNLNPLPASTAISMWTVRAAPGTPAPAAATSHALRKQAKKTNKLIYSRHTPPAPVQSDMKSPLMIQGAFIAMAAKLKKASKSQSKKVERSETSPRDLFYRQITSQSGKNDTFCPICEP